MNEWEIKSLNDISESVDYGLTASAEKTITDCKFLRITDIVSGNPNWKEVPYVTLEKKQFKKYKLHNGDIVIARTGATTGYNSYISNPPNAVFASYLVRYKIKPQYNSQYISYYLKSYKWSDFINGVLGDKSAQPNASASTMAKFKLHIPPIKIQNSIAKILSDLDQKIENNRKINETLEAMAQAVFKSWFVDFEPTRAKIAALEAGGSEQDAELAAMTAISGKDKATLERMCSTSPEAYAELKSTANLFPSSMVDSELGEIPNGWEVKGLDNIANYLNGLALQKFRPEDENNFLPVLKISQLKKGAVDGAEKASPDIKPEYIVDNGDIVFSWSGSLVVDVWCGGKAALNQHLFKVTSDEYPKWLYYLYTNYHLQEFQRIAAAKAVTMGHIKREHLAQALCTVPCDDLIEKCNSLLGYNLIQQINLRIEALSLTQTRDALLPKLLSGEIDVGDVENIIKESIS